ncbi:hypothetical protein [uncultured Schumannella sp.]|uniref:hypothetical protein n=1 Tax=uncultured Schumannella sp. TaxID=1195956 RepID=UPI0025E0C0C4|nr:hypothetical protein [uncultured Schumannella sp.]
MNDHEKKGPDEERGERQHPSDVTDPPHDSKVSPATAKEPERPDPNGLKGRPPRSGN